MKKILLFLWWLPALVSAQPIINLEDFDYQKFQWGYYFGLNTMDFRLDYESFDYNQHYRADIQTKKSNGFNVGLTGDLRLIDYLNLRFEPGLVYNKRQLDFPGFAQDRSRYREVVSTYIYIPILLKYSAKRWDNFKPYLTGGASMTLNLSANNKSRDDNAQGKFRVNPTVFFYELGFGVDFYTPHFRFTPSIRGLFSINNELIPDADPSSPWTGNLRSIYTRAIMINLTFE